MSLSNPHPLWTHAHSPFEVSKAVTVARMLSGRYRTDLLSRHWTRDNPAGLCRLSGCSSQEGSLQHILLYCPALADSRASVVKLWSNFMVSKPQIFDIVKHYTITKEDQFIQFLLDPSCLPLVISSPDPDTIKHCLYLTRTWCFSVHLSRTKQLRQLQLRWFKNSRFFLSFCVYLAQNTQ